MKNGYVQNGYFHEKGCFAVAELAPVYGALQRFHAGWMSRNKDHYEQGVINSAYLTDSNYMSADDRKVLYDLINSTKILDCLRPIMPNGLAFMNTQLFFGPADTEQKNYWHRDIQYTGMSVAEQQAEMAAVNVIHCRIPLEDEPGIELVPGTHKRWDNAREYETRMTEDGRNVYDPLPNANEIPLAAGDMLVFSANMIHRGLYAPDRFALDIIYCDPLPRLLQYAKEDCLPNGAELAAMSTNSPLVKTKKTLA